VADDVFHRAAVLGHARGDTVPPGAWARLLVDRELREVAPVITEVDAVIARVRELLDAVGEPLRTGDLILGGSPAYVPVAAGESVTIEIDGIDQVRAALTDLRDRRP
jgi:2-keto-4-pentenoate hydratase